MRANRESGFVSAVETGAQSPWGNKTDVNGRRHKDSASDVVGLNGISEEWTFGVESRMED